MIHPPGAEGSQPAVASTDAVAQQDMARKVRQTCPIYGWAMGVPLPDFLCNSSLPAPDLQGACHLNSRFPYGHLVTT